MILLQPILIPMFCCFALVNLMLVLLGYQVVKKRLTWLSWAMLIISVLLVYLSAFHCHPILKMLVIIATTFTAMKVIAVAGSYKNKPLTLTFFQWAVFAGGWAGMRAEPFEALGNPPLPNAWAMVRFGISRVIAGLVLVLLARKVYYLNFDPSVTYFITTALLLVGFSLTLHFGLLSISAGTWRLKGVNTYMLFKQPVKATSLTEFWGKRWNMAFSEMTSIAIFRPLRGKLGNAGALMVSFAFSGLLHELALSLPVNSGYGLPMLYFVIQGALVLIEKVLTNRENSFLQSQFTARLWTLFWVIAPMPLLFHAQFIRQVVWPLAGLHL